MTNNNQREHARIVNATALNLLVWGFIFGIFMNGAIAVSDWSIWPALRVLGFLAAIVGAVILLVRLVVWAARRD